MKSRSLVHRRRSVSRARLVALTLLAVTITVPGTPASASTSTPPFEADFQGTFTLTFFTGEGGTHELLFHGRDEASHLGNATVDGYSRLRPSTADPSCSEIVHDEVTLTAADGSRLELTNDAVDCMEITPDGRILIHGRGTYQILGGTGRFAGSTGAGTVSTEAIVTGAVPGGVTGTFDPLAFAGTLAP